MEPVVLPFGHLSSQIPTGDLFRCPLPCVSCGSLVAILSAYVFKLSTVLSNSKINQHLLCWALIQSSFTSHPHLPLYHPPSLPLLALVPKKCMMGNLVRARLSTPGLSAPICSHFVWNVHRGPGLSRSGPGNWCCLFICFLCLFSLLTQRPLFG